MREGLIDMDVRKISELSTRERTNLRRRLLHWFSKQKRKLPWRKNRDPYAVWVSEIMLQQTQVATVIDYFTKFMKQFPTVERLAEAEETTILRLWEGLGYYRRARQMHAAAKEVVTLYGGAFPKDVKMLQALPGIGRYTAGAIASIAHGGSAPIVEANTARLYARLIGYDGLLTTSTAQNVLWETAGDLIPRQDSGEFNQALMELGSLVCTPKNPDCTLCPLKQVCYAFETHRQHTIPQKSVRATITQLHEAAVIVEKNGKILLRQCGVQERWAGLWDFPRFRWEGKSTGLLDASKQISFAWDSEENTIEKEVEQLTGICVRPTQHLKSMTHSVTRYRIELECFLVEYVSGKVKTNATAPVKWVSKSQLEAYPLSTSGRKMAKMLEEVRG